VADSLLKRAVAAAGPEAVYKALTPAMRAALKYEWRANARPEQLIPPGNWRTWLYLAGRGVGKTRTGSEAARQWVKAYRYVNFIGATADDARDIMIEGESGILARCPDHERPRYLRSDRKLIWPSGAVSLIFTADEPERLRGKQHEKLICDELASWRYPEAWTQAMLGLRLGDNPQALVTTTPRPTPLLRALVAAKTTYITRGTTYDNRDNLAAAFFEEIIAQYEGTRLGRQELMGELLSDIEGALWTHTMIDRARLRKDAALPAFQRVVVAVDPSGSAKKTADEAGIVVVATGECFCKGKGETHAFVLEDLSGRFSPRDVGERAVAAYHRHEASRLVAEDNFGGQIVADLVSLIDDKVAYKAVRATRGKIVRAEPVAAMYEQGRVHHVGGFGKLEDEMTSYTPLSPTSPGRFDALVWGLTELMLGGPSYDGAAESTAAGARREAVDVDDFDEDYGD
jgi:phage terminase large subunit-like protein